MNTVDIGWHYCDNTKLNIKSWKYIKKPNVVTNAPCKALCKVTETDGLLRIQYSSVTVVFGAKRNVKLCL